MDRSTRDTGDIIEGAGHRTTHPMQPMSELGVQQASYKALGELNARKLHSRAAKHKSAAVAQQARLASQAPLLERTAETLRAAHNALLPITTRPERDGWRYWPTVLLLLGGDLAGIAGAAIAFGEVPALAIMQATSVAVAAVTIGTIAVEYKHSRAARRRAKDDLTLDEQRFADLFQERDSGERIVRLMTITAFLAVVLIVGAIFALRSTAEDSSLAGMTFGCMAGAVALGSFFNAYTHADEVSDRLARCDKEYRRELRRNRQLTRPRALRKYDRASAKAESIRVEHTLKGVAAEKMHGAHADTITTAPQGHAAAAPASLAVVKEVDACDTADDEAVSE
ncbi:MAG TPA: hypothetical protein VGI86_20455 [Acidimicrobiia bacterium]